MNVWQNGMLCSVCNDVVIVVFCFVLIDSCPNKFRFGLLVAFIIIINILHITLFSAFKPAYCAQLIMFTMLSVILSHVSGK